MTMRTVQRARRGTVLVYATIGLTAFIGFASFAVDYGRVQMVKTELTSAVDSAAMAGASVIKTVSSSAARTETVRIASLNAAFGNALNLQASDVVLGKWNSATRTLDTASNSPDAVQVTGYLTKARGTAIPLSLVGAVTPYKTWDAQETATAVWVPGVNVNQLIYGTDNPFLIDADPGEQASENNPHDSPDTAGTNPNSTDKNVRGQSPRKVEGNLQITGGDVMTFDKLSGTASHDPNLPYFHPDGEIGVRDADGTWHKPDIGHNNPTPNSNESYSSTFHHEYGIHDVVAPINALVGVFLGPDDSDLTPVPTITDRLNADCPTDFTTAAARKREVYRPQLKQLFFIGDGTTKDGDEPITGVRQKFVAPPGATRLVLANWDFYEWNNNDGERTVEITRPGKVVLVK